MLGDRGSLAFPPSEHRDNPPVCVPLSERDRAEMLYHDHPVLIKSYQIYVSEQGSREADTCTCVSYCQQVNE